MKKIHFLLYLMGLSISSFAQDEAIKVDSLSIEKEKKLELNLDIVSRYIWRGQAWGGNYIAVQPTINYALTPKITIGFWATTNFKNDYFYPDGITSYKGYQEIDFNICYQITDFLQLQLWDYYWPSVEDVEGVDNSFFNYGKEGVKTVDAIVYFDFSEGYKYPFNATISTLVAGNDYRYDSLGENPKQNFTTYLELGYTIDSLLKHIEFAPVIGAVLNNKAEYYSSGDYDKVSFVNMGMKATREFDLGKGISMPVSLNYIHNGATKNTEAFGKDFFVASVSFSY